MAAISMGSSNLMSPMNGASVPMGSMTPSGDMKYSSVTSPHSHSPMSTPGSTPSSTISNGGKSVSNSKDWHMSLMSDENELFGSKCKRKINFSHIGIPKGHQPATVARRNARERNRVKQVIQTWKLFFLFFFCSYNIYSRNYTRRPTKLQQGNLINPFESWMNIEDTTKGALNRRKALSSTKVLVDFGAVSIYPCVGLNAFKRQIRWVSTGSQCKNDMLTLTEWRLS